MKIGSVGATLYSIQEAREVRSRKDGGGNSGQNPYDGNPKNKDDEKEKPFDEILDSQKVNEAVAQFGSDAQTQGLTASVENSGPGLRVVLKDGSGAVIRQFTGEEFVRMREETRSDGRKAGKILDQKL